MLIPFEGHATHIRTLRPIMQSMPPITEYYTANHPLSALVVLRGLKIMYFKNNPTAGYGIRTLRDDDPGALIDDAMRRHPHATDFSLRSSLLGTMFFTLLVDDDIHFRVTAWTFRWDALMRCLPLVQRHARRRHMRRRLEQRVFSKVGAFRHVHSVLPDELVLKISELCLQPPPQKQCPVRTVHTRSFRGI
jgi:hypothetical protein